MNNKNIPRLRMFAGPNGSGKSTIKSAISSELLGIYINPDEIEKGIFEQGFLDFSCYQIKTSSQELSDFLANSSLLKIADLNEQSKSLTVANNKLIFDKIKVNAYFASVAADFIRNKLLEAQKSFTFETVMSSPDKVEFLHRAQKNGYRTYLYLLCRNRRSRDQYRSRPTSSKDGRPSSS